MNKSEFVKIRTEIKILTKILKKIDPESQRYSELWDKRVELIHQKNDLNS